MIMLEATEEVPHWIKYPRKKRMRPHRPMSVQELLWELKKVRKEIVRLTPQLVYIVNDLANGIAEFVDEGTTVKVPYVGHLSIVFFYAGEIDRKKVLVIGDPRKFDPLDRCPGAAFGFDVEVGTRWFYNGDYSSLATAASRNNYISFATHFDAIISAFKVSQDMMYPRILKAFGELRRMVGST